MTLSTKHLAHLRGLAHDKKPVVLLGQKGVTDAVITEIEAALLAHELIKIRLQSEDDLDGEAAEIAQRADAELCGRAGKVAILYREHPERPRIHLPRTQ
jgi:RNA-binding protein